MPRENRTKHKRIEPKKGPKRRIKRKSPGPMGNPAVVETY